MLVGQYITKAWGIILPIPLKKQSTCIMGECCEPDNLTVSTVQWHRCNYDGRIMPGNDGVGVVTNPYAPPAQASNGSANRPFEHKSIPFRDDVLHPVKMHPLVYQPTGISTFVLYRSGSSELCNRSLNKSIFIKIFTSFKFLVHVHELTSKISKL